MQLHHIADAHRSWSAEVQGAIADRHLQVRGLVQPLASRGSRCRQPPGDRRVAQETGGQIGRDEGIHLARDQWLAVGQHRPRGGDALLEAGLEDHLLGRVAVLHPGSRHDEHRDQRQAQ
ncbi:hypothetical protein D9V37_07095 [Nocardioides mangrovicus]|uniref:Uncharacterized protein n=1 Tax=Nocardioides mangrovicus TaxID=2478913 RepID=A0A3L8P2N2_9ACTN|nr:hypothetical protein D9V37_07095 [Nocardioides mangrovicus]